MARSILQFAVLLTILLAPAASAAGQDSIAAAKELYAAASYDDALKMLRRLELPDSAARLEAAQYQVFCLIALDRSAEAEKVVLEIFGTDPLFAPDANEASPRVVQMFDKVRAQAAPELAKALFAEGKAAMDRKDRDAATKKFQTLLDVVEKGNATQSTLLNELKLLASGYIDLARATPAASSTAPAGDPSTPKNGAPVSSPSAPQPTGAVNGNGQGTALPTVGTSGTPGAAITPAVPINEVFPPYAPQFLGRNVEHRGVLRLKITAEGRVESAEMVEAVHPTYDPRLLDAARKWRYQPAKRDGVAVASERTLAVVLKQ